MSKVWSSAGCEIRLLRADAAMTRGRENLAAAANDSPIGPATAASGVRFRGLDDDRLQQVVFLRDRVAVVFDALQVGHVALVHPPATDVDEAGAAQLLAERALVVNELVPPVVHEPVHDEGRMLEAACFEGFVDHA